MIEIVPLKNLDSEITVPGSKYIANRVLLIAALANGDSTIKNVPENEDINATINALKNFKVKVTKKANNEITIKGTAGILSSPNKEINVHNSGTLLRFITGFASLAAGKAIISGAKRIQERPIHDLLKSLNDLGIRCRSINNGFPPVEVIGGTLKGGSTKIKGDVSSQFISSLLLIAPYAKKDTEIIIESGLVSKSYVDMTINLMEEFGIAVENENYKKFRVKSGQMYSAKCYEIPADWSSANYFLAAAAIIPGRINIRAIGLNDKGESGFVEILKKMGCSVNKKENSIEITGNPSLKAIESSMSLMPDSVQTLAAVSVFAKGAARIKGIGNLKYKESDRINDTASELKKIGIEAIAKDDELMINGGIPRPAIIDSHNDHRMAMSFALVGLKVPGIRIKNPECVAKSFPNFWQKLQEIGAKIKTPNIVLMGYRGTGKTHTAEYLSKKLGRRVISTDQEIEKKVGSLPDFVKNNGWQKFRDTESAIIQSIGADNLIIDAGGGFIERQQNIGSLKKSSIFIWLKATPQQIKERVKEDSNRPSLTGKGFLEEINEVLKKREPIYRKAADFEIDTNDKSVAEAGEEILALIK